MHICRSCARIARVLGALSPSALRSFSVPERTADLAVPCAFGPKTASGAPSPRARVLPYPFL
eukprot:1162809-Pleurochrysis_carterae.AAC.1